MREKGLGTPATRAQIIEGLIAEKYVYREGRELVPTAKAFSLMTLLHGLGVPELFSPELTAEWEYKLAQMEHGKLEARRVHARDRRDDEAHRRPGEGLRERHDPRRLRHAAARCPKCGGEVHENYKKFQCQSCDFGFWKIMGGRQLEVAEADTLLRERSVGPLDGFRSRLGRPFSASLKLNDANEVDVRFRRRRRRRRRAEAPDFTGQEPLGRLPEVRRARVRDAAGLRLREGGRPGQDLRLPLRPRDPAAAGRARADAEAARHRQDRSAAIRLRAHQARRSPRSSCASRTARSASSSRRGIPRKARRAARARARPRRCACSARIRTTRSRSSSTPGATART